MRASYLKGMTHASICQFRAHFELFSIFFDMSNFRIFGLRSFEIQNVQIIDYNRL